MRDQLEAEDYQTKVLYELCSIIINTLQFPPLPFHFPTPYPYPYPYSSSASASASSSSSPSSSLPPSKRQPWWTTLLTSSSKDSPAAFASLFLCISVALMLVGSVIFLIGFLLLPWVTLLVLVFYVAALVSNLSALGHFILGSTTFHKMSHMGPIYC